MEWLTALMPGNAPDAAPILSVLGKKTYRFANGKTAWEDEEEQIPILEADEFNGGGKPDTDSVKHESDMVAYKPMTDVALVGHARVPGGKKIGQMDVGIQIGAARKIARVFGDRKVFVTASGFAFSPPEPFSEMPLDYSLAYGGRDEKSDDGVPYVYPKNPVGKGFVVKSTPASLQDLALPNLEDPAKLLTPQNLVLGRFDKWKEGPVPVAFGFQNKNFHPRFTLAGLPPEHWADAEADRQRSLKKAPEVGSKASNIPPQVPPMLNPYFFNGAAPGLSLPFLKGDEAIKLAYLDADHPQFTFNLPGKRPRAWIDVGEGPEEMEMALHTVVIYKDVNRVTLTWRGCAYYGGIEAMKKFTALEYGVKEV